MSKIQSVKPLLSAAADEILEDLEKIITGYEEEMFQSKREISRQRKMIDALKPEIKLNRISEEAQLNLSVWEEDFLTEQQQEWNSSPRQKNPESLQTERSHKEPLSSSQNRRPEDDTIHDTFTPQCEGNEQEIYKEEEEPVLVTSAEQMQSIETDEDTKMSQIQCLRVLVKHFLSAAADRIVEAVEKMIAGYEEEMHQSKREISRQCKMLHVLLQPEIRLTRIPEEAQLNLSVWEEDFFTEQQQELNSSPRLKNPESLQTERSHKEPLSSSQDRRPEDDTIHDTFTPQCEENEHKIDKVEEEPLSVPSPGFSEPENGDDDDWNATQDVNSYRSEEWGQSTLTGKKTKKKDRRPDDITTHDTFTQCEKIEEEIYKDGEEPLPVTSAKQIIIGADEEVPSPGFDEAENGDEDEDWKLGDATQDTDSDRSEDWRPSTLTVKTPQMKKKLKSSIICKVCGKDFHSEVSLVNHLESHPKDYCGLCGMRFKTEEDFNLHLKTHKNVKAKVCDFCGKSFGKTSHLKEHMRIHMGEKPFKCEVCGKSFTVRSKLTRHLSIHTVNTSVLDKGDDNAEVEDGSRAQKNVKVHVCDVCGKCFARPSHLEAHMRSHRGEKPFKCSECDKSFSAREQLTRHLRTHTGETSCVCNICGKCFSDRGTLKKHTKIHTGEKPFICEVCGKSFRVRDTLTRHLRTHTLEKPYSCTACSKCFRRNSHLREHMQTHLKDQTFTANTPVFDDRDDNAEVEDGIELMTKVQQIICKVCGKDFNSEVYLVNHLESHPKDGCGLCGVRFKTGEDFKLHLKTHKKGVRAKVCDFCGKCFGNSSHLEAHMRTHTGVKPFRCEVCGKSFRVRSALTIHFRLHTGEKPYWCPACGKCFRSNSNLRGHMRTHLKDKTLSV